MIYIVFFNCEQFKSNTVYLNGVFIFYLSQLKVFFSEIMNIYLIFTIENLSLVNIKLWYTYVNIQNILIQSLNSD